MKPPEANGGPAAVTESDSPVANQSTGSHNNRPLAGQDIQDLSSWKFFTVLVSVCSASFLAGYVSSAARGCAGTRQGTAKGFSPH